MPWAMLSASSVPVTVGEARVKRMGQRLCHQAALEAPSLKMRDGARAGMALGGSLSGSLREALGQPRERREGQPDRKRHVSAFLKHDIKLYEITNYV